MPPFVPARRTDTRPAMTPRRCASTPRHGLMDWPTLLSLFLLLTLVASPVSCSTPPSSTWTSASTSASTSSPVSASRLRSQPPPSSSPALAERASSSVACVPYQGAPATGGKCDYVVLPAASPYPANILLRYFTHPHLYSGPFFSESSFSSSSSGDGGGSWHTRS